MQEKKGGIPGENALEKGRTVMIRKIIADNGKTKEGENI